MSTKKLIKALGLIIVVALLAAVLPMQAKAATICVNPGGTGGCYSSIQTAINAANAGDTINVAPGEYEENVIVNKAITLQGAGSEYTTIVATDGNATPLIFNANGATVRGFHLTHNYTQDELDDWNFKNNGVAFYQPGNTLSDCKVTKNRNGIYINNAQGNIIRDNTIENNRTGLNLTNTVNGTKIEKNTIQNNWTLGLVYYQLDFPTNFDTVTVEGNSFNNNWYSEILIKDTSDSTGTLDVTGNTFSDDPVTYTTSADIKWNEPGFASLKPEEFGGTATMPTTPLPTLRIYNVPGVTLQYDHKTLMVGVNQPYTTIQSAIADASDGDTINVAAGTYTQEGALVVSTPNLTIKLSSGTVIQNSSPCFVVNASYTKIYAEPGAKCIPTGSNGIDVAAGLTDIRVEGLEIDGSDLIGSGDGIYFAGSVNGVHLVSNNIHDLDGDAITFATAPTGSVTIAFNRFYNNDSGINILDSAGTGAESMSDSLIAENNWWGCNAGPGDIRCDSASQIVDYDPWLVLKITSEKQIVEPDEEIQIDANLIYNSAGQNTLSDGYVPDGITAKFSVQAPGDVDPVSTETVQGQVSTSFTPTVGGVFNVCVTVDNQTECTEDIVVPVAAAVDDIYRMMFNSTLDVGFAEGVTKNDTGITEGFDYTVSLVSGPAHGQLELKADGSFKYIPEADFLGEDAFVYQLVIYPREPAPLNNQNPWTDQATVTISVEAYQIFMPLILK